jgi:hypothetical protein
VYSSHHLSRKHSAGGRISITAPVARRSATRQSLPARPAGRCACGGGCPHCQIATSNPLTAGPGNDAFEQEANRVADSVTSSPGAVGRSQRVASAKPTPVQREASPNAAPGSAPPSVNRAIGSGGKPLPDSIRSAFEPRFGHDFSGVRIHTDSQAARSAADVQANAYTVGRDIVFGAGKFAPDSTPGRHLLAHELTHVVQQDKAQVSGAIQRQPATGQDAPVAPRSPADLKGSGYHVIIVGSPGEAEVKNQHPYQFADAAKEQGTGFPTVWLVERSGYENGGVSLDGVTARAGGAPVFWITESTSLATLIGQFPNGSIASMDAYSHGLPGLLALRHGWPGQKDYGLTTGQAKSLSPASFAPDATISFDSCNSATGDEDSLAQSVANSTQRAVRGWTGRTSYRKVNAGTGGVVASEIMPSFPHVDTTELGSQLIGRYPRPVIVAPESSPGDFSSWYSITARLPQTRKFQVKSGQSVKVNISAQSEYTGVQGLSIYVLLNREVNNWFDDEIGESRRFAIGTSTTEEWTNLDAGTYYVEIYHLHGVLVTGSISVSIR